MTRILLLLLVVSSAFSCKYDNTVNKYVYNYSNDTIRVFWEEDSYILLPGEIRLVQTKLYEKTDIGIPCEQDNEFTLDFSSGRTLIKDLNSTEAWEGNIDGKRRLFQECYLKIYEVDLE